MNLLPCHAGVGLKPAHFTAAGAGESGLWFEVHPENYMVAGGPRLDGLIQIAADYPVSLHGVGASLGGPGFAPAEHLGALRRLIDLLDPAAVSEHAVWSALPDRYFADLLPLPRTGEALARLCAGIEHFQEGIGRSILLENPANYLDFMSEMDEPAFLVEVAQRTGCGLLLDVSNVYVSANNCGIDPVNYIHALPPALVGEVHIAGFSRDANFGDRLLIDSHAAPVAEPVWSLLEVALRHLGPKPVLLERDDNLPAFDDLLTERNRAEATIARQPEYDCHAR